MVACSQERTTGQTQSAQWTGNNAPSPTPAVRDLAQRILAVAALPQTPTWAAGVLGLTADSSVTADRIKQAERAFRISLAPDRITDHGLRTDCTRAIQTVSQASQLLLKSMQSPQVAPTQKTAEDQRTPKLDDAAVLKTLVDAYVPSGIWRIFASLKAQAFDEFVGKNGACEEFRRDPAGYFRQESQTNIGARMRELAEILFPG